MGPKYEFTDETMKYDGHLFHRIRRLSNGEIGGWIESEDNLSQDGDCWVEDEAKVYGDAKIYDNAIVTGKAVVYDHAEVYGNASVYYEAYVSGYVEVYNNARVCGNACVWAYAKIYGNAKVYGDACVYDHARVYGNVEVYGKAKICGYATVYRNIKINDELYYKGAPSNEDTSNLNEVVQDFIYKVDESNKITTQTEYDSVDEFFSTQITNDIKLDTLVICTIDTKEPLIKLQKVEKENKLNYRFIVDITIDNGDNFSIKSTIETQEQLNQKLEQTIEALKQYPEFAKYVDDLESCL